MNLPPGEYLLYGSFVNHNAHHPLTTTVFYPGVTDLNKATTIALSEEDRDISFPIHFPSLYRIAGKIRDDRAELVQIELLSERSDGFGPKVPVESSFTYEPTSRTWTIPAVPNGNYLIRVDWVSDRTPQSSQVPIRIHGEDWSNVNATNQIGQALTGHVQASAPDQIPKNLLLVSQESLASYVLNVTPDGAFSFPKIRAGRYRFSVPPLDGLYVSELLANNRVQDDTTLNIIEGLDSDVSIRLASANGQLSGLVIPLTEGDNQSQIMLVDPTTKNFMTTESDQLGRFSMKGIPPGEYLLFSWPRHVQVAYREPIFLERYKEVALPVRVEQNEIPITVSVREFAP